MAVVVSIANPSEPLGWRHALLILACERAAALLAALGASLRWLRDRAKLAGIPPELVLGR